MMTQRYKFYSVNLLLTLTILLGIGCSSSRFAKKDTQVTVHTTIETYIKALNNEDIKILEVLYADDFMSYTPLYKLPKKQLLEAIQDGFDKQDYKVQGKITEITSGPKLATAHLQWMIIGEQKEIIFAQNLLQVWKKEQTGWKLSRILFYTANEVLELKDFKF